jgi:hypothetical protein
VKTPWRERSYEGSLEDMDAASSSWDQTDSVLIPENILQSLLGVSGPELILEASHLANENGWTARLTPEGHWLFERKNS